jgi:hypothetical protein
MMKTLSNLKSLSKRKNIFFFRPTLSTCYLALLSFRAQIKKVHPVSVSFSFSPPQDVECEGLFQGFCSKLFTSAILIDSPTHSLLLRCRKPKSKFLNSQMISTIKVFLSHSNKYCNRFFEIWWRQTDFLYIYDDIAVLFCLRAEFLFQKRIQWF